jgi:hypothetical protein
VFVFFGRMSKVHPVQPAPVRCPEDNIHSGSQHVLRWDDNTGIPYPGDGQSRVQLHESRFFPYYVYKLTRLSNGPDENCTEACF